MVCKTHTCDCILVLKSFVQQQTSSNNIWLVTENTISPINKINLLKEMQKFFSLRIEIFQVLPTFKLGQREELANSILQVGNAFHRVSNTFKLTYDLHLNCSFPSNKVEVGYLTPKFSISLIISNSHRGDKQRSSSQSRAYAEPFLKSNFNRIS